MKLLVTRGAVVGAVAALGLAVGAGAASASTATFSATGQGLLASSGNLVFKVGTTPTASTTFTCPAAGIHWQAPTISTGSLSGIPFSSTLCPNGSGQTAVITMGSASGWAAVNNGGAFSLGSAGTMQFTISTLNGLYASGGFGPTSYSAAWTNGTSVASPSVVAFADAQVGKVTNSDSPLLGQKITLTGAVKVARSGGSLLTLS
jgi:hypothetical protein